MTESSSGMLREVSSEGVSECFYTEIRGKKNSWIQTERAREREGCNKDGGTEQIM